MSKLITRPAAMMTALIAAMTLTACAGTMPMTKAAPTQVTKAVSPVATTPAVLAGNWQLQGIRSADKLAAVNLKGSNGQPISLNITQDTIFVTNGCNNMAASYQVANNQISTSHGRSTMMMCDNNLMAIDQLAASWFSGKFMLSSQDVLMAVVNGQHYEFARVK